MAFYGFHRLIYDFAMALLWLYYDFTSSIPYVLEVEWIDDEYVMKKGCYPEVWLLLSTAY